MSSNQSQKSGTSTPRSNRLILAVLLLFLVGAGAWWALGSSTDNSDEAISEQTIEENAPLQKIDEPAENLGIEAQTLVIDNPTEPTEFELSSGTVLTFPASAFVDESGQALKTPISVRYREFRTAAEIVLSGIPMRVYDNEGGETWMKTAGMFEIEWMNGNQPVQLASNKEVIVQFASMEDGDYNFWKFDEAAGNWLDKGLSTNPKRIEIPQEQLESEIAALQSETVAAPVKPMDLKTQKLTFTDLDYSSIPELKNKSSFSLIFCGTDEAKMPENNPWIKNEGLWMKKQLLATDKEGVYELSLIGDSLYQIPVKLAPTETDLAEAEAMFEKKLAEYYEKQALLKQKESFREEQYAFQREMRIVGGGLYNYDLLIKLDETLPLMADFKIEGVDENTKNELDVYLITEEGRTVIRFPRFNWSQFSYLPKSTNSLIALVPGEKLAVFSQEDFNNQEQALKQARNRDYTFEMTLNDDIISSVVSLQNEIDEASL